ncbi:MAG: carboxylating nicotinate-nucleotide diphosphorylase [Endomicrobium sp.]|jgi:nicotinate-nucleotide pyrophosphorylase (carboxylating)|nr:carboxylating nicotinate-nucleotide diphosphorylase [Endomicrobium sp.]
MFDLIKLALDEDKVFNDITTKEFLSQDLTIKAVLISNTSGILCGINNFIEIFTMVDKNCRFELYSHECSKINKGTTILKIIGSSMILSVERIALNILQYMSGIATLTNTFVNIVHNKKMKIYDTRKIIPGYRNLAKYAVRCGGGINHRMNLSDMILIKDNHLKFIDDLKTRINEFRLKYKNVLIEIECENYQQVMQSLYSRADIIMLDNMTQEQMKTMINIIRTNSTTTYKPEIEISGGINLETAKKMAHLDVDRVSIGMITQPSCIMDFTLEII